MVCEFTEQVSALIDGELEEGRASLVQAHVAACAECQRAAEEFATFGRQLKTCVGAPDLVAQRQTLNKLLSASDKRRISALPHPVFAPTLIVTCVLFCIALLIASFFLLRQQTEVPTAQPLASQMARKAWEVERITGTPKIGTSGVDASGHMLIGEWLETDSTSRARVDVADIGHVEVEPNSRVRLVETSAAEHRLALAKGKISALIYAPPRLFFVDTPSAVAVDYGCAYTLEVDECGGSILYVTAGWVALEANGRESFVPAGAACATEKGKAPGTPYFKDASASFISALQRIDFAPGDSASKIAALDVVLREARKRDGLTLWHLLARTDGKERERVFERLSAIVPPPGGVTRNGALSLDKEMLEEWKEKFDLAWSEDSL